MNKIKVRTLGLITILVAALAFLASCVPATPPPEGTTPTFLEQYGVIIFIVILFAFMWFTTIRPQRKRQKEHQQLVEELQKGDRVITAGGIYGQIESVSEDSVVIKVESGATMRVAKRSVALKTGN